MASQALGPSRARRNVGLLGSVLASPRAVWRFFVRRDTPLLPKLMALFTVVYIIWPADLIPDIAPFIGWLDDVGFVALTTGWLARAIHKSARTEPKAAGRTPSKAATRR